MSLGTEHLGKGKAYVKKSNDGGFKSNPYDLLDDLLYDDDAQITVRSRNKYISQAAKTFLEEMNLLFNDSDTSLPILAINLEDGVFKFVEHLEDKVSLDIPVEWDIFEQDIRSYIGKNPIVRKEIVKNPEGWDKPYDATEVDLIDKSMSNVKDQVKHLQDRYNLNIDEVKEALDKFKSKAVHVHNKTTYTAQDNAELQLRSGTYNNMVDLVKIHGWGKDFEVRYGKSITEYMRGTTVENIEKRLLSQFGFEYCIDKISVDDNPYWNNRVIEVQYENQKDEDFDIDVDMTEFENTEKKNNIELELLIDSKKVTKRIKKGRYTNIIDFLRRNKIYNDVSKEYTDKTLEEYLTDNADKEMSTEILSKLFGNYKEWSCDDVAMAQDDVELYDYKTAPVIIASNEI